MISKLPEKIGPYRIIELLGHGAMGVVYRGEHIVTGKTAAVKTVLSSDPNLITSIRREIRALARIQHPCIAHILEEGIEDDSPWYAMELLNGVTLRQYCAESVWYKTLQNPTHSSVISMRWWTHGLSKTMDFDTIRDLKKQVKSRLDTPVQPDDSKHTHAVGSEIPAVLTLISQICRTLAFLHGKGMVHGDLKPENILVRDDGIPVIMDFGLVTRFGGEENREELEAESTIGGSIYYMAPEQIRGEFLDARADLYSLGCILYEIVTGRVPFSGENAAQIIHSQLEIEPVPPSDLESGVPEKLDQLIIKLLSKLPQDRVGYANDVTTVLIDLGADEGVLSALPKPQTYLYRSRFRGRQHEIHIFEKYLDQLDSGKGNLLLINGESGIGKTRLLKELMQIARDKRIYVLLGECLQVGSLQDSAENKMIFPLQALRRPINFIYEYCRKKGRAETDRILGPRGKVIAMHESKLLKLPGQDAYPDPVVLPSDEARLRLYTNLLETFSAFTVNHPCLLVIDDLQWADELTLGFLEYVLRIRRLNNISLLIACTYRTEEVKQGLQRILNLHNTISIGIERFSEKDVGAIAADMIAVSKTPHVIMQFLARFSDYNPFFMAEYLRSAVAEGILYRDSNGCWHTVEECRPGVTMLQFIPLPDSILNLVKRRLKNLSEHAQKIVSMISVIGREIPVILLWNVVPFYTEILDVFDELSKRQILYEKTPGQLYFVHDLIRQVAYESLSSEQCIEYHRKVALALETVYGNKENYYTTLAQHWEKARDHIKAQKYFLASARQAVAQYAMSDAEQSYRGYLKLVGKPNPENIQIRDEFVKDVLLTQARNEEALIEDLHALQDARNLGLEKLEGDILQGLANIYIGFGNIKKGEKYCLKSLEISRKTSDQNGEATGLNCLAEIRFHQGRLDEAKCLCQQSADIYRQTGDQFSVGISIGNQATISWIQGDLENARSLFETALTIYEDVDDKLSLGKCIGNYANIIKFEGDYEKARELYEKALAIAREIGNRQNEGIVTSNLASTYYQQGDLNTSQQIHEEALKIHRVIMDRSMEGFTINNLAIIYRDKGFHVKANDLFQHALSIHQEIKNPKNEAETLYHLGVLKRFVDRDLSIAKDLLDRAISIFQKMGDRVSIGLCLKQLGHLRIADNMSSEEYQTRIQHIMDQTKSSLKSELGQAFQKLRRSEEAFKSGGYILCGECVEDIPDGLRKWLIEAGELEKR